MLLLFLLAGITPVFSDLEATCPELCVCETGKDESLQRPVKAVTCSGFPSSDLPALSNLSTAIEVLHYSNTSVRRVDFLVFRRFSGLLELDLSGVGIHEVGGTGKTLTKLTTLDLGANNLYILRTNAFRDFPVLTKLNLSSNGLHTILSSALVLPQLKILDLRRNRLAFLKAHYFSDVTRLQEVYLANNILSVVSEYVFSHNLQTVDLSNNHIIRLEDSAFEGINVSGVLNLGQNSLRRVPNAALKRLGYVRRLILDGNPLPVFGYGSVVGLSVSSLSVSYHKNLHLVHRDAFVNLVDLEELEMRGNPALIYIDPQSLVNVPKLRVLDLSNNALFTLEEKLLQSTPALTILTIANNSFACHCSLSWLQAKTKDKIFCTQKSSTGAIGLNQLSNLSATCSPYIIPLFPTTFHETIGNNVSFHCRALGSSDPKVSWLTKNSQKLVNGNCEGRLCVLNNTLTIKYLHHEDTGSYTCMARDTNGEDSRAVSLQVRDGNVRLFPLTVASTFVTLAWNISNSISYMYKLRYEENSTDDEKEKTTTPNPRNVTLNVGPKVHSYTVHGLRPGAKYSFYLCIQREDFTIDISTTSVTTREEDFLLTLGIERSYLSVILMSVIIGILLASCLSFCGIQCWRQRLKLQQQSSQLAKSESGLSGCPILQSSSTHSDMAFITYINLNDDVLFADHSTESTLMHGYA